jgi:phage terminase large subunit
MSNALEPDESPAVPVLPHPHTPTLSHSAGWRRVRVKCSATQRRFLQAVLEETSPYDVVGFGGARGGGKTYASCLAGVLSCLQYPHVKVLLLRKGLASAVNNFRDEVRKILRQLEAGEAARWLASDRLFRFHNGAELHLGFCASEEDYERYQGVQYDRIGFEEATQHTELSWDLIGGSNRPNNPDCRPRRWVTCNPGGIGHEWVRRRFVDPLTRRDGYLWIPSTLFDNPAMLLQDPGYAKRVLDPLPEWKRRQWKEGDWDAVPEQYWSVAPDNILEISPTDLPRQADWYAGVDWGKAKPFAVIYVARWQDWVQREVRGRQVWEARDRAHAYAEVYKAGLDLDEQAALAKETEKTLPLNGKQVLYYADPATGKETENISTNAGATIRSTWAVYDFIAHPARTNARVPGWNLIKLLLRHRILTISPRCAALLSEMRQHTAEGAPGPPTSEDLQQSSDVPDHATDALRYCIVSTFGLGYEVEKPDPYLQQA